MNGHSFETALGFEVEGDWDSAIFGSESTYPSWVENSPSSKPDIQATVDTSTFSTALDSPLPISSPNDFKIPDYMHEMIKFDTKPTQKSTPEAQPCGCLDSMLHLIERAGIKSAAVEAPGVDSCLIYLRAGSHALNAVSACAKCNLCLDNTMLVVTVAQQLSDMCCQMGDMIENQAPMASQERLIGGTMWFGRYSLDEPELRRSLAHSLVILHLDDLRSSLEAFRLEIGRRREAWKLVVEAEGKIKRVCARVKELGSVGRIGEDRDSV